MRSSVGYIIGIVLTIGVGAVLQYFLCCGTGAAEESTDLSQSAAAAGMPFHINDPGSGFEYSTDANFDFPFSSYTFLTPLPDQVEDGIDQLRDHLNESPDATLQITGYGYSSEDNLSAFPTLGEARANAVKSAFIDRGIAGNQLTVGGALFDMNWTGQDSVVRGPVAFSLQSPAEEEDELAIEGETTDDAPRTTDPDNFTEFVQNLQENPMVLHFETGSAYVNLTSSERQIISRLNQYIDQSDQAQIIIHGHTDNSGSPEVNTRLAKERAEFLKSYLVRNGFRPDRIQTISYGQSRPVASNDTPEGMAENRRAVLTIEN